MLTSAPSQCNTLNPLLQFVPTLMRASDRHAAAVTLVNWLAARPLIERVSLGYVTAHRSGVDDLALEVVSQTADFDRRGALARQIESALQEAVDQRQVLTHATYAVHGDTPEGANRAQKILATAARRGAVQSLPLMAGEQCVGALTVEYASRSVPDPSITTLEPDALPVLAAALSTVASRSQPLSARIRAVWAPTRQPAPWWRSGVTLACAGGALLITMAALLPGTYRVAATAAIEGSDRQVLVAPQAGFVLRTTARAGDVVQQGATIAELDDRELMIEQARWISEIDSLEALSAQALAGRDRVELGTARAEMQRVRAELDLVQQQLSRVTIKAPFDGVLVAGDLDQSLGAPVDAGEILFEIASMDRYRLVLHVAETDVGAIQSGQTGQLRLTAMPSKQWPVTVESMLPVATTEDERSVFRVLASLDDPGDQLRPGMQGIARIDIAQRSLLWIWTHRGVDRLRLWLWQLIG